jgi:spore coat polysaccharide biosynthesis predicted glycosyltransferase SpsG
VTEVAAASSSAVIDGRRLLLRADGSASIGLGHVMRLLALGQAWFDASGRVEALLQAPDALLERYRREGFDVRVPSGDDLADLLRADLAAVAAIDRSDLSLDDLRGLGEGARRTLVVDDLAMLPEYPVGLVLNQNAHADPDRYGGVPADRLLLGLRYVLLRREFRSVPQRTIRARARRLLVTFGGGDPAGMTVRALEAIGELPDDVRDGLELRIIVGAANTAADRIDALAATGTSGVAITVERAVEDMVEAMTWADLAIASGGSTVWELARTGCSALVVAIAPAEIALTAGLEAVDLFDRLGSADELDVHRLAAAIAARLRDTAWRERMARRGQELVDGRGAERVVAALAGLDAR